MDDFQPEYELKPETSDRPGRRKSRTVTNEPTGSTRQYLMTGIGIVVLLLLIVGIGAAINGPKKTDHAEQATRANIEPKPLGAPAGQGSSSNTVEQEKTASEAAIPKPSQPVDVLGAGLPVSPATLDRSIKTPINPISPATPVQNDAITTTKTSQKPAIIASQQETKDRPDHKRVINNTLAKPAAKVSRAVQLSATTGNYTLQLSGATSKTSLKKWADAQRLKGYQIIETQRQGKAWFILVSGDYRSPAAAKKAIASLPIAVQAKNPWVKPLKHLNK